MSAKDLTQWYPDARVIPSPNFDSRPVGVLVDLIIIHAITLPPGEFGGPGIEQLFTNSLSPKEHPYYEQIAGLKVSSHFVIRRDGELLQFVPVGQRAWHAGLSEWQGRERCNDFSVGIELEGDDVTPFTHSQYATLTVLLTKLIKQLPISAITSHSFVAPGRKTDPGPCFDWSFVRNACPSLPIVP